MESARSASSRRPQRAADSIGDEIRAHDGQRGRLNMKRAQQQLQNLLTKELLRTVTSRTRQ